MLLQMDRYFFSGLVGSKIQQVPNLNTKITNFLRTNIRAPTTEVYSWNPYSDRGMFFARVNINKMTVVRMTMKMAQLLYVFISFIVKFFYVTATHEYFREHFFPTTKFHLYLGGVKAKTRTETFDKVPQKLS